MGWEQLGAATWLSQLRCDDGMPHMRLFTYRFLTLGINICKKYAKPPPPFWGLRPCQAQLSSHTLHHLPRVPTTQAHHQQPLSRCFRLILSPKDTTTPVSPYHSTSPPPPPTPLCHPRVKNVQVNKCCSDNEPRFRSVKVRAQQQPPIRRKRPFL